VSRAGSSAHKKAASDVVDRKALRQRREAPRLTPPSAPSFRQLLGDGLVRL